MLSSARSRELESAGCDLEYILGLIGVCLLEEVEGCAVEKLSIALRRVLSNLADRVFNLFSSNPSCCLLMFVFNSFISFWFDQCVKRRSSCFDASIKTRTPKLIKDKHNGCLRQLQNIKDNTKTRCWNAEESQEFHEKYGNYSEFNVYANRDAGFTLYE